MITSCPLSSIARFRIQCNPRGTCHAGYHTRILCVTMRGGESHDPPSPFCRPFAMYEWIHPGAPHHTCACPLTAKISSPIHRASSRTSSNKLQDLSSESQSRPSRVVWIDDEVLSGQVGLLLQCIIVVWVTRDGYFLSISNDGGSCYLLGFAMNSNFISSLSHNVYHLSLPIFTILKQSKACICWFGPHTERYVNFLLILCTLKYKDK